MWNKGFSIDEIFKGRKNNLDIIRFFAATLVIFSHAFPLTLGNDMNEPFVKLTNGQSTFGSIAVYIFFIVSGFLITMSYDKSKNTLTYLKARILRIFPGLIVVILLTVFVLGPLTTSYSLNAYFNNPETYNYFKNITLVYWGDILPGVFENNIHGGINGSLWTLYFEFIFYLVVAMLGVLRLLKKRIVLPLYLITLVALFLQYFPIDVRFIYLFAFYAAGMLVYLFRDKIYINNYSAIISLVSLIVLTYFDYFQIAFSVFGTYLIMYLAFSYTNVFHNFSKYGDFSYGLYIYAFPIQQLITMTFNNEISPYFNFIIALPLTLIFAIFSWHIIEKPAIKLKNIKLTSTLFQTRGN
ncbi:acyltransferase family protein [Bacillus sp. B1-b2]|uniref:acyltransferase family protein n=1 Tax=Bacillus sp. B1-b2 TaxID=2653201 RepID=UPI001261E609|nr:acyltransferase [Bacillus sp. B1-b2]KAB7668459.1 acyltransferase [Bacillus sp. B1-b2]